MCHHWPAIAILTLTVALVGFSSGCSPWSTGAIEHTLLKPPRMSADTVVLEMALVDVSDDEGLWREVDEQHLPVDTRRKLAEQGIRGGVLGSEVPCWIKDRLVEHQKTVQVDEGSGAAVVGDEQRQRHLQCRNGQPRAIELGPPRKELDVETAEGDPESRHVLKDAQCQLSVVTEPHGDGRVRVQVTPEICHGPPRTRWVGTDGSFRIDLARDSQRFEELTLAAILAPGQTLVLSSTPDTNGLGECFFLPEKSTGRRRVVLLRLAQTQFDDIFAPPPVLTPIATDAQ